MTVVPIANDTVETVDEDRIRARLREILATEARLVTVPKQKRSEQFLRLECLRLAVEATPGSAKGRVAAAREFHDFICGKAT